jgi:hypothetical protein
MSTIRMQWTSIIGSTLLITITIIVEREPSVLFSSSYSLQLPTLYAFHPTTFIGIITTSHLLVSRLDLVCSSNNQSIASEEQDNQPKLMKRDDK